MHEIRHAFRALRAAPVVSAVAILSLALGIGANTAMFSILDSLLLRSLPVADPQRLVMVGQTARTAERRGPTRSGRHPRPAASCSTAPSPGRARGSTSRRAGRPSSSTASGRAAATSTCSACRRSSAGPGQPTTTVAAADRDGAVAVISYGFWQRRFGGAADVIGRSLIVERVPFTIVGVTPPGFFGLDVGRTFDVAIPLGTEPLDPRQGELARSALELVAERHGPAEGRPDARGGAGRRCAASSRRSARRRCRRTGARTTSRTT